MPVATVRKENTPGESRVALIGVHAMRYLPGCVLTSSDHEQLLWCSHILPDGVSDVAECLRPRALGSGEVVQVVTRAFDAFSFNAVGQSSRETPGGIAWDGENVGAWSSFFSSLLRIAEVSEGHFPPGPFVFAPGEAVPILHAHFVTLWRYLLRRYPDRPPQETEFQLLGELDLYSPLLSRAVKGAVPAGERETSVPHGVAIRAKTVRFKATAEPPLSPTAGRKKKAGTIALSPALRKLTTQSLLQRNEHPAPEPTTTRN